MVGATLSKYLSLRFLKTIGAVFGGIFALIYLIDFVELLRRSSDVPSASAGFIALLSLLRVPAVSEQILPFAVLFGAMAAFLNLTRKLELVVARAAGVSAIGVAWGYHSVAELTNAGAHRIVETFTDLPAAIDIALGTKSFAV